MTGDMLAIDELIVLAALLECGPLHSNDPVRDKPRRSGRGRIARTA